MIYRVQYFDLNTQEDCEEFFEVEECDDKTEMLLCLRKAMDEKYEELIKKADVAYVCFNSSSDEIISLEDRIKEQ